MDYLKFWVRKKKKKTPIETIVTRVSSGIHFKIEFYGILLEKASGIPVN